MGRPLPFARAGGPGSPRPVCRLLGSKMTLNPLFLRLPPHEFVPSLSSPSVRFSYHIGFSHYALLRRGGCG